MKLTYNGPQESRTLELPDGTNLPIEKGKAFEVPDEVGKQLLEQGYFKKSTAKIETAQAAAGAKESE
jgi:hypothetical protein